MICFRILAVLASINWLVTVIYSAGVSFIKFAETRPSQIPNGGFSQIATVPTSSAIRCAKLCWDNVNSTGCWGIIYQPDTCSDGNKAKSSSSGLCQMLGSSETTPLTFGAANQSICQKFYSLPLANCSIVAQSYSRIIAEACNGSTLYDQFGYVRLNGKMVFNMSICTVLQTPGIRRGVNLLTVDPVSCTIIRAQQYDTYASAANAEALATNLSTAANGTLFVAVTADDAQRFLASTNGTLLNTCNVNVTSLQFRGNFAFVCVIGRPKNTKWQLKPLPGVPSVVAAAVTGTPVGGSLLIV